MEHLTLLPVRDETTLSMIKKMDTANELRVDREDCFWLGAVSNTDRDALKTFLQAAQAGDIQELVGHASFDDSISYAILVRDACCETRFHIFVIELKGGFLDDPRIVFGKKLPSDYNVDVKPAGKVPSGMEIQPKLEVWKSFLNGVLRKGEHK